MKFSRETIRKRIIDRAGTGSKNGYVPEIKDNLISSVSLSDFIIELGKANGNELNSKFKALYSSSALCVNFFGYFKRHLNKLVVLGEDDFKVARFEEKLSTGLKGTAPNLDFFLENDASIIGIESKFLEVLTPKQPKFASSYSDSFLEILHPGLSQIVKHYRTNNAKTYLDTSQLIKHSMGLLNQKKKGQKKRAKLIYVYWEPINASEFFEYSKHEKELVDFAERMKTISGLSFHHFTYSDLHKLFSDHSFCKEHLTNFKNRYFF